MGKRTKKPGPKAVQENTHVVVIYFDRNGAVTNVSWWEDAEDDDPDEGGLGRSTGVTTNPVS